MKGWYCIYECSKNQWLLNNQWWQKDRDLNIVNIPTQTKLDSYITHSADMEYQLIQTNYQNVVTLGDSKISAWSILTFETLQNAEKYLLNAGFSTTEGQFYSIRKIYF